MIIDGKQQPLLASLDNKLRVDQDELKRLLNLPRLTRTSTTLLGKPLEITDPFWYVQCYRDICENEIYRFHAERLDPLIIDCGANIGVSVIYFKFLYPGARVIAFEPDPVVFSALQRNVAAFQLHGVELHCNAVWSTETTLCFAPDGSVGGRIVDAGEDDRLLKVKSVRLRDFLDQPVDFLKLDIEGAEYEVLKDCAPRLTNVRFMFVEYHGSNVQDQILHKLLQILHRTGFRYHAKEAWPVEHPFVEEERPSPYDLQLNIFAYRNWSHEVASSARGIAAIPSGFTRLLKRALRKGDKK